MTLQIIIAVYVIVLLCIKINIIMQDTVQHLCLTMWPFKFFLVLFEIQTSTCANDIKNDRFFT